MIKFLNIIIIRSFQLKIEYLKMKNSAIINKKKVNGFVNEEELLLLLDKYSGLLIALGIEKILIDDENFEKIINSNLTYPDGIGAVYALKRKGIHSIKIPGAKLWLKIIRRYYLNKKIFLLGSKKEVINSVIQKLKYEYKGINIVGFHHGYFEKEEIILESIYKLKPDLIFVALGSPKQEIFMDKAHRNYKAIYMGLGGSFDLYIGKTKDVPEWWKKYFKWEGLFRLIYDIGNIKRWKRQLIFFHFIGAVFLKKI